jgi:hypothetical protein
MLPLRNQIVEGATNLGQSTENPSIVEVLDFTFRTIEKRTKRYRNLDDSKNHQTKANS